MSQQSSSSHKQTYFQFFKSHPIRAIDLALGDEQLKQNSTILYYKSQFRKTGFRIFRDMCFTMLLIKVGTIITHYKRSLALSAPKNVITATIKYIAVPGAITYMFQRNRYQVLMSNLQALKDVDIEERYQQIIKNDGNHAQLSYK